MIGHLTECDADYGRRVADGLAAMQDKDGAPSALHASMNDAVAVLQCAQHLAQRQQSARRTGALAGCDHPDRPTKTA